MLRVLKTKLPQFAFLSICLVAGLVAVGAEVVPAFRECHELLLPAVEVTAARSVIANQYLDRQAANWVDQHSCVSCHTVVPFVVGRSGAGSLATEAFVEIEALVKKRVNAETLPAPWYSGSHTHSSHATESVVNSLILSKIDSLKGTGRTSATTLKAFRKMAELQNADGSWEWLDFNLQPWETQEAAPYGASLAAVAISRSPARARPEFREMIRKMKAYLKSSSEDANLSLWNRMSVLWAESEITGVMSAEVISKTLSELMSKQLQSGGFSMNHLGTWKKKGRFPEARANTADGYATAYSLFILKQVNDHGQIPEALKPRFNAVMHDGVNWLVDHQTASGTWTSASLNNTDDFNKGLVEDAATGFALAVLNRAQ
jgi:hypothetical protein